MPDRATIRALYDQHMRAALDDATMTREVAGHVVRYLMPTEQFGFVLHSSLTPATADAAIQAAQQRFAELGYALEWKYFDYDTPEDLPARLVQQGFTAEPPEAVMVLDIETAPPRLTGPFSADVRKLDHHTIYDADAVHRVVWSAQDKGLPSQRAITAWEAAPESLSVYAVYVDDQPVAYARLEAQANNPFAYLWSGATLPDFRGRGFYTALVAARLQEAHKRDHQFLVVDAMPDTSMPIVAKLGFEQLAMTTPFQWTPSSTE